MSKQALENQEHRPIHILSRSKSWTLWEAWVAATAIAEFVGLGIVLIASTTLNLLGTTEIVAVLHLVGLLQGIILGFAQWLVLRRYIKHIGKWIAMTAIAASIAWLIGIKASAIISFFLILDHTGTVEVKTLALARAVLLLGAWVGSVLGLAQWLVLREHIRRAGWWIFANAIAWAFGLLVAYAGTTFMTIDRFNLATALAAAATGLTVGAVVGGITGIALLWLLKPRLLRHAAKPASRKSP
ncbi:hypothetical protein [Stenomitos frigidus]|uniref:Uncharacterized protein n=1 Tax=Stenomitos frigidus ULC18 TaxID=2107698 RepID=A0A2T1E6T2_9CYAN|nr:hypothetical protein [Stenomitos frigidus]PSB28449.1 hypothetical protein C7B82_13310 [Stenomitos frigidus ULC18]